MSERRWTGAFVAALLGAVCTVVVTFVADVFIDFAMSTTCGDPASAQERLHGELALAGVWLLAAVPWLLLVRSARDRRAVGLVAGVALLPATLYLVYGLSAQAWVGSFCF